MSAPALSATATLQTAALLKGPHRGQAAAKTRVRVIDEVVSVPVGAPSVATATDYIRFGIVPAGAKILAPGSLLSSNHTATVAGSLVLVPVDGIGSNQTIASVVANIEATETTSIPDAADSTVVTKDSWVQFVPASDLTIASTAKNFWLRLYYAVVTG